MRGLSKADTARMAAEKRSQQNQPTNSIPHCTVHILEHTDLIFGFTLFFHSAHSTEWAESISGNGVCQYVSMYVCHHFEDDHYSCSQASETPITIHILKAYDESYSKIIRGHKYKDKDNDKDNDKDKDTEKVPEKPNICYIFEILMTYSFQI